MRSKTILATVLAAGLAAVWAVLAAGPANAAPQYVVTDVGTLGGSSVAYGVNNAGQVVGYSEASGGRGFLWDSTNGIQDLGTLGGSLSSARGINGAGQIAGFSAISYGEYRGFLRAGGVTHSIGVLGGNSSDAYAVNDDGWVVGFSTYATSNADTRAVIWNSQTGLIRLSTENSYAKDINSSLQVAGYYGYQGVGQGRVWTYNQAQGTVSTRYLSALPGDDSWKAYAINNEGWVAGTSSDSWYSGYSGWYSETGTRAVIWKPDGSMLTLGYWTPNSINNQRQIVGGTYYWDEASGALELNACLDPSASGWTILSAYDISDNGLIAAYARTPSGTYHGVLLTPVPEPATLSLLALGGLLVMRRRRGR